MVNKLFINQFKAKLLSPVAEIKAGKERFNKKNLESILYNIYLEDIKFLAMVDSRGFLTEKEYSDNLYEISEIYVNLCYELGIKAFNK